MSTRPRLGSASDTAAPRRRTPDTRSVADVKDLQGLPNTSGVGWWRDGHRRCRDGGLNYACVNNHRSFRDRTRSLSGKTPCVTE